MCIISCQCVKSTSDNSIHHLDKVEATFHLCQLVVRLIYSGKFGKLIMFIVQNIIDHQILAIRAYHYLIIHENRLGAEHKIRIHFPKENTSSKVTYR